MMYHQLKIDNNDIGRRLLELSQSTGYGIIQLHGQRIYGGPPPDWSGSPPMQGTEVYCYRIPRDCFEDELVPVFSSIGKIYELRLMVEFSGANRCYCYVRYCRPEDARRAIGTLNNYEIRPGHPLAVTKSVDNRKLCIKTVPPINPDTPKEMIIQELGTLVAGVTDVTFLARSWLQVEFESHRLAALARRLLVPRDQIIFGRVEIKQVDWADPEAEDMVQTKTSNKVVCVKNVPRHYTEQDIKHWFNILTEGYVENVVITDNSTVMITFLNNAAAVKAMEQGSQIQLHVGGERLELSWWQPQSHTRQRPDFLNTRLSSAPMPLYTSPPPAPDYVGPLERLFSVCRGQGWGAPCYESSSYLSNGERMHQYHLTLPSVSKMKIYGQVLPDKHEALMDCAKAGLQAIVQASQEKYLNNNQQQQSPAPGAVSTNHYRTPAPSHTVTKLQTPAMRANTETKVKTVVRPVKAETNLVVEDDAVDDNVGEATKAMENLGKKPVLAVLPNRKTSSRHLAPLTQQLMRHARVNIDQQL